MYKNIHYPHSYGTIASSRELFPRETDLGLGLAGKKHLLPTTSVGAGFLLIRFFQLWLLLCFFFDEFREGPIPHRRSAEFVLFSTFA